MATPSSRRLMESLCVKVPKAFAEKTLVLLNKVGVISKDLEISRNSHYICIPLNRPVTGSEVARLREQVPQLEIATAVFETRKKPVTSYFELLESELPPHLLASLPRALDVVGDLAIIELPTELDAYKTEVGKAILETHKRNVRTVLAKVGAVSGTYRLREYEIIAGEPRTWTVHKEHGCQYYVDVARAYFSPRLSHEHERVASLVKEGETVLDLFSGVGPFAILIAKTHEKVTVHAVDANPEAVEFLKKDIRLNRVEGRVHAISGDARGVVNARFAGVADRVIMNLPEKSWDFVDVACTALKPEGGVVHFYCFINVSDPLRNAERRFAETVETSGRRVGRIFFSRLVRATAPYEWQAVLDANIR